MNTFQMVGKINPKLVFVFEQILLNVADQMVEGYNGGRWKSKMLGKTMAHLVVPGVGPVNIVNTMNYSDQTMDRESAGAAITLLAFNQMIWAVHDRVDDATAEKLNDTFYALKDAILDNEKLNTGAIISFID